MPEPGAAGYAPLGDAAERQRRRALFLQSYRFSVDDGGGGVRQRQGGAEWLGLQGGRLARRLREAGGAVARAAGRARGGARWRVGAGLARAWRRGWWMMRPRADPLLGCFGSSSASAAAHHKYYLYLHGYV